MDAERYKRLSDLFTDVCEKIETGQIAPNELAAYLGKHAPDDQAAEQVLAMLDHHDPVAAKTEGETIATSPKDAIAKNDRQSNHASTIQQNQSPNSSGNANSPESHATLPAAVRTHATPRHDEPSIATGRSIPRDLLAAQARRQFRLTGAWLYLLFLIPTAVIGLLTFREIQKQLREVVANELDGVTSGVRLSADRFLQDKSRLVSSWSRTPALRDAVEALARVDTNNLSRLRNHPSQKIISDALVSLSGTDQVKYVVWNRSMVTIASWSPDRGDVGLPAAPSGMVSIAKVLAGQTVMFGPQRLLDYIPGFEPETDEPVVGMMVPIFANSESGDGFTDSDSITEAVFDSNEEVRKTRVVAVLLIRGLGWFDQLSAIFTRTTMATRMDTYLVNREGIMLTPSMVARTKSLEGRLDVAPDSIAALMRVVDPGTSRLTRDQPIDRDTKPITLAVADLRKPPYGVRIEPYANYSGEQVVGATQVLNDWDLGVIVESPAAAAFGPVRLVRNSYLLLASLLLISSLYAASRIAKQSTDESAAVHPLARYDIVGTLGSGGMATVYRVRHKVLGRDSALKILPAEHQREQDRSRFDREARLAASLANPHSVTIYDYGRSPEGNAYCVMEYLRGLTIAEVISRDGPQPVGRVLSVLRQICDALIEGHQRELCHRDIKPHNIMLSLDRSVGDWAVVFDYGLAKPLHAETGMYQTAETVWSGTPMYMAPERFRQPMTLDPRSDIYSVGAVAYFMLAGKPPFLESEPETLFGLILNEEPISISISRGQPIPDDIEQFVKAMMNKSVDDRVPSMLAASKQLDKLRVKYPWTADEAVVWWKLKG